VGIGSPATSTIEMNTLKSIDVSSLNYGSLIPSQNSTGDHTAVVTNTGNVITGFKVSGTDLSCSVRSSIPVGNQQYAFGSFVYGNGTALSASSVDTGQSLSKPTQSVPSVNKNIYWQISVPAGLKGTCGGSDSFIVN
jgi:hypothetical protein